MKKRRDLILALLWTITSAIWILDWVCGTSSSTVIDITKHIAAICSIITAGIYWFMFITDKTKK